jgi:DNA-directed RNA polymerase
MDNNLTRQIALEREAIEISVKKYRDMLEENDLSEVRTGIELMKVVLEPVVKKIAEFRLQRKGGGRINNVKRFLEPLSDEVIAFIVSKRIINSMVDTTHSMQNLAISITKMLEDQMEYDQFKEGHPGILYNIEKEQKTATFIHKYRVITRAKNKLGIHVSAGSVAEATLIGMKLLDLFIEATGLVEKSRKGFTDTFKVAPTEKALEWIEKTNAKCELLSPLVFPCIIKPKEWDSPFGGGLYSNEGSLTFKLIKTFNNQYLKDMCDHDMPMVYRAINSLQNTHGESTAGCWTYSMLSVKQETPLTSPFCLRGASPMKPWDKDEEPEIDVLRAWKKQANAIYDLRVEMRSKRIATEMKRFVANKFKDEPEIYFCWTMDWRGRVYPLQPHVNPQADDLGRSLLEYAEAKPLGENGGKWLAIHGLTASGR